MNLSVKGGAQDSDTHNVNFSLLTRQRSMGKGKEEDLREGIKNYKKDIIRERVR